LVHVRRHWADALLVLVVAAAGSAWVQGDLTVAAGCALAALIAQGALVFVVVPRYHAARADASLWQTRAEEARTELARLHKHAIHEDEETGVGNSRQLEIDFVKSVARVRRRDEPFSLAVIEVGHALRRDAVDSDAIVAAAGVLLGVARAEDSVCRVDERLFAVLLAGADVNGGRRFVDRVRTRASAEMFRGGRGMRLLELRGGVAQWCADFDSLDALGRHARRDLDHEKIDSARQAAEFHGRTG
jgi:GGDEF domain-containing protein